jgi:hypothetical protein
MVLLAANLASADLVVNQNLGTLSTGVTTVAGNTATGANNADYYGSTTNPAGNWANELVYQFTLANDSIVDLALNFDSNDTDFFLLDGLTTTFDGIKNVAQNDLVAAFLDFGPETLGFVPAGTYYLSAETFAGFDPPPGPGPYSSMFDLNITVTEPGPPTVFTDLGIIATFPAPFSIDTFGSDFDTELGAFTSSGGLSRVNDDAGGTLQSQLNYPLGARPGLYYLALGGFNTTFDDGFIVSPGTSSGNFVLNYPNGVDTGVLPANAIEWYRFEVDGVVSPPSSFIDLGVVANQGNPLSMNTFGSDFDTEIGVYDMEGFLLADNDDAGGTLQSLIDFTSGLSAGDYYVALGGFNTAFFDAFAAAPGASSGNWTFIVGSSSASGTLAPDTIQWIRFQVVPEPMGLSAMIIGLFAFAVRRRSL